MVDPVEPKAPAKRRAKIIVETFCDLFDGQSRLYSVGQKGPYIALIRCMSANPIMETMYSGLLPNSSLKEADYDGSVYWTI
jgi:hypothetical protein